MIVPHYWAEARLQRREQGRQVTVRRFGWSDDSQEDAEQNARLRTAEALARVWLGEALPRSEPKVAYNGAEGMPIREQILAEHGDVVITRNGYGAQCLNTPDVLFADVDFDDSNPLLLPALAAGVLAAIASSVLAQLRTGVAIALAVAAAVVVPLIAGRLHRAWRARTGGAEGAARRRVALFVQQQPQWRLRVYRTPMGLRLLAMHATFAPTSAEVARFFAAIGADPIYVKMCQRQQCFRARVSPKPWRIGLAEHIKPRPGVWPVAPERLPDRERWVEAYTRASAPFASCRYVETLGSAKVDRKVEAVRALHDQLCRADSTLPLA